MERIDIILKNDDDELYENKTLLEWLNANYRLVNKNNYYIKLFSINYDDIDNDKIDELAKLNIIDLPVLLSNNKVCCKQFSEIKDYIINIINNGNSNIKQHKTEDNDSNLDNWMLNEINAQDDGIEEPINMKTIETKEKTIKHQNDLTYNTNVPKTKLTTPGSDEDLMQKYWDNQNIT